MSKVNRWIPTFLHVAVYSFLLPSSATCAIISTDTTINSTNSFPSEYVTIADGPGGPTNVTMVDGGMVGGFTVAGSSVFEMKGGTSTFLSSVEDDATFIMRGGTIECSEPVCLVSDYVSLLHVTDNSIVHMFGGTFPLQVRLEGNSTWHFYGRGLSLTVDNGTAIVAGELASGEPANYSFVDFNTLLNPSDRIFLHAIPEPQTAILAAAAFIGLVLLRRNKSTSCL